MVTIIDYDLGNHVSIMKLLGKIGIESELTADHAKIEAATKLILPGVGNFGAAMSRIKQKGLFDLLNRKVLTQKTPILGICLGMQLMTKWSDESQSEGFGWFDASCHRFKQAENSQLKVPHVGWNTVDVKRKNSLIDQQQSHEFFYFTHSYHAIAENPDHALCETTYGVPFCSALNNGHIFGTQFHPEKSYDAGFQLLKNFVEHVHVS